MIKISAKGNFRNTEKFLKKNFNQSLEAVLNKHGAEGVSALAAATPVDSGLTSSSWGYEVKMSGRSATITWTNSHVEAGVPIAIILQYGHGTGTGAYIQGRDYINPAIQPIFDRIATEGWKVVSSE